LWVGRNVICPLLSQDTLGGKQPYYFTRRVGQPITIAGIWEQGKDIETGEPVKSVHDDHHDGE
jgi:putative SOS response-associated peptidase YedK